MTDLLLLGMMFVAGIAVAVQPSVNARLAEKVGVIESACISFAVGTFALLVLALFWGKGNLRGLSGTAWWEWSGGLLGAFFVWMMIFVVPRIGTAAAMSAVIAAQLMTGVALDHFGAFGLKEVPLDLRRVAGCLLLLGGVALVGRR